MPYTDQQLIAWYEELGGQLPRGTISFGVDSDAGKLFLALSSDHDDVAVQSLLEQLPPDAVAVRLSDEHWYGHGPRVG
jgi:hypothetical protein